MTIRCELPRPTERDAVHAVHRIAFDRADEADLVDALWSDGAVLLSLLAELDARIAGHVLFTRMWIECAASSLPAVALAPVAVLPEFQRRGIAAALIRDGLAELKRRGETIVLVLGHPDYYARFGFSTGAARGLTHPFPSEAYMALALAPHASALDGAVRYAAPFGLDAPER